MKRSGNRGPALFNVVPRQRRTSITQLHHPVVRDLAWALTSQPLFQAGHHSPQLIPNPTELDAWLWHQQQNPERLEQALSQQRSHRLGIYFETLIHIYLHDFLKLQRCLYGLAVRDQGHTYGEYDFLLQPARQAASLHLEISLKFYLGIDDQSGKRHWLGLNRSDLLEHKYNKLINQQLQLSRLPVANSQLRQMGVQVGHKTGLIKGRLFYPFSEFNATSGGINARQSPRGVNPQHLRGWWLPASSWQTLMQTADSTRLVPLQRRQWMAVLDDLEAVQLVTAQAGESFAAQLDQAQQPMMCARLGQTKSGWKELDRGVLVPDPWLASVFETFNQA